ncbi:MAG: hypothetical protein R2764_12380 [Bacteroidales bacterium]
MFCLSGPEEESEALFEDYKTYAKNDKSIYKHLSLATYYSYKGDAQSAIKRLKALFEGGKLSFLDHPFFEIDPLMDGIKDLPEFKTEMKNIESKFWKKHNQIKTELRVKGLI